MSASLFSGWLRTRSGIILLIVSAAVGLACLTSFLAFPALTDIAAWQVATPLVMTALAAGLPLVAGLVLATRRLDEQKQGLAAREELFKTAQRIGKLGYWHLEAGTDRLILSDSVHELLGDRNRNFGLDLARILQMVDPDDRDRLQETFRRIIENGSCEQFECRITGVDGVQRWLWIEGQRRLDAAGNTVGACGACQDITDRLTIAAALRESEDHYRHAVKLNPQIPWTADPEGNILEVGPVWLELMGMTREETIGRGWTVALHPDDVEPTVRRWSEALASGAPLDLEYRLRLAEGSYRWFRARAAARRDEQGRILRWYGTAEDIHDRKLADAALRHSEAFARSILESTLDCVNVIDLDGRVQFINKPGLVAMEMEDFEERRGRDWAEVWPPDVLDDAVKALAVARAGGCSRFFGFCPTVKGKPRWWDVTVSPILGPDGLPDRILAISRDMSDVKLANDQVERARTEAEDAARRLENVLSSTTDGVITYDREMRFTYVNREARRLLGDRVNLLGKTHREVFPGREYDGIRQHYEDALSRQEFAHFERYVPSQKMWVEFHVYPSEDGLSVFFRDVSERHRSQEQLHYLAHHDTLTGLANRILLRGQLEDRLRTAGPDRQAAVLFLDLDDFKSVNDSLGHRTGDVVLVTAAERLKNAVRRSDVVSRFGGDEFVVVAEVSGRTEAAALAKRIIASLSKPYEIEGRTVNISVSIGISIVSSSETGVGDVKRDADIALYRAKAEGRGTYRIFEAAMGDDFQRREELKQDLRGAVARGEFRVIYQPLVDLATSRINGFEALSRWEHPRRGTVKPSTFIPLAEESGVIVEIGRWVLATACREAASWPDSTSVAVPRAATNMARKRTWNVRRPRFEKSFRGALLAGPGARKVRLRRASLG